jgi:hypothetical protein
MASPYFQFGGMRQRFAGPSWNAGYGGVLPATRSAQAAEARSLGDHEIPNLLEMTLGPDTHHTTAFRRTSVHQRFPRHEALFGDLMQEMGDFPLIYPKGPEAFDPNQDTISPYVVSFMSKDGPLLVKHPPLDVLAGLADLSDNERLLALAGAAAVGWWLWKRSKKGRKNPSRLRYEVFTAEGGAWNYSGSFATKASADQWAKTYRRQGMKAKVRRR